MSFAQRSSSRTVVNASSVSRLIPPEECTTPKRPGSAPLRRRTALKDDSNSRHNIHEKRIPRPSTAGLDPLTMLQIMHSLCGLRWLTGKMRKVAATPTPKKRVRPSTAGSKRTEKTVKHQETLALNQSLSASYDLLEASVRTPTHAVRSPSGLILDVTDAPGDEPGAVSPLDRAIQRGC
jgi:hypothetical protein